MINTNIEWADHTWNPWIGCTKVSEGCKNCYMAREMSRWKIPWDYVRKTKPAAFNFPLTIKKPGKIFVCSWSDFFHHDADTWRVDAWDVIKQCPQHTFQILTKRPERIKECLPGDWGHGWPNVWLGVSVENQDTANKRIIQICRIPAKLRFISVEPLLGFIDLGLFGIIPDPAMNGQLPSGPATRQLIHWIIDGGESGPITRLADPKWFRFIREQCKEANIPYFHKQNGGTRKQDGHWGGNKLDGKIYNEMPGV